MPRSILDDPLRTAIIGAAVGACASLLHTLWQPCHECDHADDDMEARSADLDRRQMAACGFRYRTLILPCIPDRLPSHVVPTGRPGEVMILKTDDAEGIKLANAWVTRQPRPCCPLSDAPLST